jgi:hypothetical protein
MGQKAGEYLRWKRGRITDATYRDYEACLDKLARVLPRPRARGLRAPVGTAGSRSSSTGSGATRPRARTTRTSRSSRTSSSGPCSAASCTATRRCRSSRTRSATCTARFSESTTSQAASSPAAPSGRPRRDRIALRLLLDYGLRKGALQAIQFKHFDQPPPRPDDLHQGREGSRAPDPLPAFWDDLAKLQFEIDAEPSHFLLCRRRRTSSAATTA